MPVILPFIFLISYLLEKKNNKKIKKIKKKLHEP